MQRLHYPYRPGWTMLVLSGLFFAACGAVLGHVALTNDRGVIIEHAIELGPEGATIFYWCLTAASFVFVAMTLVGAWSRSRFEHHLTVDDQGVELPVRGWKAEHRRIAFTDMREIRVQVINGTRFAVVKCASGKFTVSAGHLPSPAEFELVVKTIAERMEAAARYGGVGRGA